jgi:small-conductance mechanosensitive channel
LKLSNSLKAALGFDIPMRPIVILPMLFIATILAAYVVYFVTLRMVRATAKRASITIDARVMWLREHYLSPLLIVIGLLLIIDAAPLPPKVTRVANRLLSLTGLGIALFIITKGTLLLLRNIATRYQPLQNIQGPVELATKIALTAVGGMLILDNLGVSLTPLLTTLGIGSLAVAIALQDTLGNVFAGVHIKADRPIEVGQFIRLESGDEGYVERIGWRSTRVKMLPNKTAVVPNSKLVQSTIINYDLPHPELAVLVPVGVHYDSDLRKVEKVTCKVIRYHTFSQSSIDFTVILRSQRFVDGYLIKHEFMKKLHERYREEGIVIPFPIRTVYLKSDQETEGDSAGRGQEPARGYEH